VARSRIDRAAAVGKNQSARPTRAAQFGSESMEPKNDDLDPSQRAVAVEPREPWEKLPRESQKAFGAFVLYRDDPQRRFKNVAEKLNCSAQNVFQWSSKYNWKLRCDSFDVEQDRAQRAEFARGRVRMRERHMQVARAMLSVAGHALREWADRIEQRLPLNLAPEQIALLTKCATELEHRTIGEEKDHKYTQIIVSIGGYKDEQQYEDALRGRKEGEPLLDGDEEPPRAHA
jgi:hypothetical protein